MVRHLYSFLRSKSGAAAAEYALILAIIGAGIALGIVILGADISSALTSAGSVIKGFVY
jgi:pilus assembly protein Flp/PilA